MSVEVMVVIFGMVLLVPGAEIDGRTDELTGVFVDGSHLGEGSHQGAKMGHTPMVLTPSGIDSHGKAHKNLVNVGGREFTLTIEAPDGDGPSIVLAAREHSVELDPLIGERGGVKPDCVANRPSCAVDNRRGGTHDPVSGTLRVLGEWSSSAASFCSTRFRWRPVSFCDQSTYDLRPLPRDAGWKDGEFKPLASAVRLDTTVHSLEALSVSVTFSDGKTHPLEFEKMTGEDCDEWLGPVDGAEASEDRQCAVLLVGNPPKFPPENQLEERRLCEDADPLCRYDRHFSAFYELADRPLSNEQRLLPYLVADCNACDGDEVGEDCGKSLDSELLHGPSCACPTAFARVSPNQTGTGEEPPAPPPPN